MFTLLMIVENLTHCLLQTMADCSKDEFISFMSILSGLKMAKLVSGQQQLVDIITDQAELGVFDATDTESVDKLIHCVKYASPLFSPFVNSNTYMSYFCQNLLPNLEAFNAVTPGIDLEILQLLAEISPSIQPTNTTHPLDVAFCQKVVFERLLELIPPPPKDVENGNEADANLRLTHVESLLFSFHQVTKHRPEFMEEDPERLKDLKLRLQYLARGVQGYIKKLRDSLSAAAKNQNNEENQLKVVALKTTTNINNLIRDLFHTPPSFKSTIVLSWKPAAKKVSVTSQPTPSSDTETTTAGSKRKAITAPEGSDTKRNVGRPYVPPAGRFSNRSSQGNQGKNYN